MRFNQHKNKLIKFLFYSLMVVLLLPMLHHFIPLFEIKPLEGAYEVTSEKPKLNLKNWKNETFQKNAEKYVQDHIYYKPFLIRSNNEIQFRLFNKPKVVWVVAGKENYFYEENYLKAYYGQDYLGQKTIEEKVFKLKKIQDTLEKLGTHLFVVLAPGKGSFYPEFIPDSWPKDKHSTNFKGFKTVFKKQQVNYLDFKSWFENNKNTSPHPLFPKTGIHWSKYGEVLAADSIIEYLSQHFKKQLPYVQIDTVLTSSNMQDTDDDIEQSLNLFFNIPDLEMGYPQWKWIDSSTFYHPKILTVADSYYWGMFNFGMSTNAFGNGQFWFYNESIYPDSYTKPINVDDINLKKSVEQNKAVLLLFTDANLNRFCFGFIDDLYHEYYYSKVSND